MFSLSFGFPSLSRHNNTVLGSGMLHSGPEADVAQFLRREEAAKVSRGGAQRHLRLSFRIMRMMRTFGLMEPFRVIHRLDQLIDFM